MMNRIPLLVAAALLSGCGFGVDLGAPRASPASEADAGMSTTLDPAAVACTKGLATPSVLLDIRELVLAPVATTYAGLAIDAGWVYFALAGASSSQPYGAIYRVATGGGPAEVVVSRQSQMFAGGKIFAHKGKLAFQEPGTVLAMGHGSTIFAYPNIRVWDVASGTSQKLANPREPLETTLNAMDASGALYWTGRGGTEQDVIARWDGTSVSQLARGRELSDLVVDDANVYYRNISASNAIMTVPKLGGVPTILTELQQYPRLLAADVNSLYLRPDQVADAVVAMKKTGGALSPLIAMKASSSVDPLLIDGTFYWAEDATLFRAETSGKAPDKLTSSEARRITAVSVDACNVYWLAESPRQLMVQAR